MFYALLRRTPLTGLNPAGLPVIGHTASEETIFNFKKLLMRLS